MWLAPFIVMVCCPPAWGAGAPDVLPGDAIPPSVLILPFEIASQRQDLSSLEKGLPDLLTACFSLYPSRIRVVDRENLDRVVAETSLSYSAYVSKHTLVQVGRLAQARYILRGTLTAIGGEASLQILCYKTDTTRLLKSFKTGGPGRSVMDLCEKLAQEIAEFFSRQNAGSVALPVEKHPEQNRRLIKGIGFFYSSQYHLAIPQFMKMLKTEPDSPTARFWLGNCFHRLKMYPHAQIELKKFLNQYPRHPKATAARVLLKSEEAKQ